MANYILKRLLLMIPTLFGVMLITFVITQFVPGGPVEQLVSQIQGRAHAGESGAASSGLYRGATGLEAEQIAKLNTLYGFDKPAYQRFTMMMINYAKFDFGDSYIHNKSVVDLVIAKLPVSISLGLWSFFIVYSISIPLGIAKAVRDGSHFDVITSTLVLIGYAIPGFMLGIALLVLFGGGSFFSVFWLWLFWWL